MPFEKLKTGKPSLQKGGTRSPEFLKTLQDIRSKQAQDKNLVGAETMIIEEKGPSAKTVIESESDKTVIEKKPTGEELPLPEETTAGAETVIMATPASKVERPGVGDEAEETEIPKPKPEKSFFKRIFGGKK